MSLKIWFVIVLPLVLVSFFDAWGQTLPGKKLIVGTKQSPPFAIKKNDGTWSGLSIDLWQEISRDLELKYEIREFDLQGLIEAVKRGSIDVAVAALTVTAKREEAMDFSHPFHTTGLGIGTVTQQKRGWISEMRRLFSMQFLKVLTALGFLLLGVGLLVWFFERKRNPQHFGGGVARGIGSAFWWSAVTMTTVGYGDKAPVTIWGRIAAIVWMFAGIITISSFTAAITSVLTLSQLESKVRGLEDLPHVVVATIPDSTSELYLKASHISYKPYATPLEGLDAVAAGEIDALVYDAPILKYLINEKFKGLVAVLPKTFERQDYAIALPASSPLREPINQSLLKITRREEWQEILYRYLGS
jgi:ABC-type amino acid transport substrate-binding protein